MKKRIISLVLAIAILASFSVTSFADWNLQPNSNSLNNNYLNVDGYVNKYMQGRKLTLWNTDDPGVDQSFAVIYSSYNGNNCMYLTTRQNNVTYAINRSSYANAIGKQAIMWKLTDGYYDSAFKRPQSDAAKLVNLLNYNEGLAYNGDFSGASVGFKTGGSAGWFASGSPAL